jgi:hypothetical protein
VGCLRGGIPIARMRSLYRIDEVGRKLNKLPQREHENLRSTCERMSEMATREMRRAWMAAFGDVKLAHRSVVAAADLPDANLRRTPMGFMQ